MSGTNGTVVYRIAVTDWSTRIRGVFQDVAEFLHEFVAVSAAFEDAGFDAAGAVGHLPLGDLGQQCQAVGDELLGHDATSRHIGP